MIEMLCCVRHRNALGAWQWLFTAALWPLAEIGHGEPEPLIADAPDPLDALCLLTAMARVQQLRTAARFN